MPRECDGAEADDCARSRGKERICAGAMTVRVSVGDVAEEPHPGAISVTVIVKVQVPAVVG